MAYSYAATVTTTLFGTASNFTGTTTPPNGNHYMEDAVGTTNWSCWPPAGAAPASSDLGTATIMACQAMPPACWQPDQLAKSWVNWQVVSSPLIPNSPALNNIPSSPMSPEGLGAYSTSGSPALNNAPGAFMPTSTAPVYQHHNTPPAAYFISSVTSSDQLDPVFETPTAATAANWQGFPGGFQSLQTFEDLQAVESTELQLDMSLEGLEQELQQQDKQQFHNKAAQQHVTDQSYILPEINSTLMQHNPIISLTRESQVISLYLSWVGDVADDGTEDLNWLCGSSSASQDQVHAHTMALLAYQASL